jgi:hypothetical protein
MSRRRAASSRRLIGRRPVGGPARGTPRRPLAGTWANNATGTIGRADLDGSEVNQRFITGAIQPDGVTVNSRYIYRYIYWANDYTIGRADLDGAGVNQRFLNPPRNPAGVNGRPGS